MKAAILYAPDSAPVYGDFAEPTAGQGSQIVELVAAGIHQLTRSVAAGRHYSRGGVFPVIPGLNAVARTADGKLVSGSGAGSVAAAGIKAQIPVYLELITSGLVQVPFRTFPLSDVSAAWTASAETGPRVVLIRD